MNALLFCTDIDETSILTLVLQRAGLTVSAVKQLESAIQRWPERPYEFILLAKPKAISIDLLHQMRAQTEAPILAIVDEAAENEQIALFDAGVDFVIARPYSAKLLISQVKAMMRRAGGVRFYSLPTLNVREVVLDPSNRVVTVNGKPAVRLTQLEFRLLYTLMIHAGQILPVSTLVEYVWGYSGEGDRALVRGLVKRLRSKIEPDPGKPRYVLNEPGVGYLFAEE